MRTAGQSWLNDHTLVCDRLEMIRKTKGISPETVWKTLAKENNITNSRVPQPISLYLPSLFA